MNRIKVVVSGKQGVGKTCLVQRITNIVPNFDYYESTLTADYNYISFDDPNIPENIMLFDLSGSPRYQQQVSLYYFRTNILIYCIAVNDNSLLEPATIVKDIENLINNHHIKAVIIVGTKADSINDLKAGEQHIQEIAVAINKQPGLEIQTLTTSAKVDLNLRNENGLLARIRQIGKKILENDTIGNLRLACGFSFLSKRTKKYYEKICSPQQLMFSSDNECLPHIAALLADYANVSFLNRILHPNRHHQHAVQQIVNKINFNEITTVNDVMKELEKIKNTPGFNKSGSLARRIHFILDRVVGPIELGYNS